MSGNRNFYQLALKISGAVQAVKVDYHKERRLHTLFQRAAFSICRYNAVAVRSLIVSHMLGHISQVKAT